MFKNKNKILITILILFFVSLIFFFINNKSPNNLNNYYDNAQKYKNIFSKNKKIKHIKIIKSYNKEDISFTEGLLVIGNTLIESSGLYNKSKIKQYTFFSSGLKLLSEYQLPKNIFAEGITLLRDNEILLLTWRSNIGFIYKKTETKWKKIKEFKYSQSHEGWGITSYINKENHPEKDKIFKSDGTSKVWFLNPIDFKEEKYITVKYNNIEIKNINELEYIKGDIFANVWLTNYILQIDSNTGQVKNIIDASILEKEIKKIQEIDIQNDVLNGIAYDSINDIIYLTGKNWKKIFEVKIID